MSLFQEEFEPMLLSERDKVFDSKDYLYEIKFDGMRALLFVSPTTLKIISRTKKDITYLFPELKEICRIVKRKTIFDGEITSFQNGIPSFQKLQKRIHLQGAKKIEIAAEKEPVIFISFDILYDGKNITKLPLIERKKRLQKIPDTNEMVKIKYQRGQGKSFFQQIKKRNLEGIVMKKIDSKYEKNERTSNWIKVKNKKIDNFLIGGYIEKKSTTMVSLLLGSYEKNEFIFNGKVSMPRKNKLWDLIKKEKTLKKSPFKEETKKEENYITPKYSCRVEYLEKSKTGILRHPVFRGFE